MQNVIIFFKHILYLLTYKLQATNPNSDFSQKKSLGTLSAFIGAFKCASILLLLEQGPVEREVRFDATFAENCGYERYLKRD